MNGRTRLRKNDGSYSNMTRSRLSTGLSAGVAALMFVTLGCSGRNAGETQPSSVELSSSTLPPEGSRSSGIPPTPSLSSGFAVTARIRLPMPGDVVAAFDSVWVRSWNERGFLWRIDPSDDRIVARIEVGRFGAAVTAMAAGEGSIWLLDAGGTVVRVDPSIDRVVARIPVVPSADFLAVGQGAVWVTSGSASGQGALYRIDPATNRIVSRTRLKRVGTVAVGAGGVWVMKYPKYAKYAQVWRIDPRSGRVLARIGPVIAPADVVVHGWVFVTVRSGLDGGSGGILKINPRTNQVAARIPVPGALMGVTTGAGDVWVNSGPLVLVQPFAENVVASVPVSPPTDANAGIAVLGSSVWLADPVHQQVVRVDRKSGPCPPQSGAYRPVLSPASGAPGSAATVSGPLPAYSKSGAYEPRQTDEVQFWWNLAPHKWETVLPGGHPSPARPGPVLALGGQGVLGMCRYQIDFRVPRVPPGTYKVVGIYFAGPGAASWGPVIFRVTS